MRDFVAAVEKAEKIRDPKQRCLEFPDPPGSHWSRDGVVAYCNYMFQPLIDLSEFKQLVSSGHAAELDKRLSEWSADPTNHPEAFWHFLIQDFDIDDPALRELIESWKQQSPSSAFALVASGLQFVNAGWTARGGEYAPATPQSKMDAMQVQIERGLGDLEKAVRLDPKLSAAYAVMVRAGTLWGDPAYVTNTAKRGLEATTYGFPIYLELCFFASERWFGTPPLQTWLLGKISEAATKQPMLLTLQSRVLSDQARIDYQAPKEPLTWSVYRQAFDQVANFRILSYAGDTALRNGQYDVAYVYLSEASRYDARDKFVSNGREKSLFVIRETLGAR